MARENQKLTNFGYLSLGLSIMALLISIADVFYTKWSYQQSERSYELAKQELQKTQERYEKDQTSFRLKQLQSLSESFRSNDHFSKIRQAVEQCTPIYKKYGGQFSSDQINQYLNFFEELGYAYQEKTFLSQDIDFVFGAFLIELVNHPFIQRYVDEYRKNNFQPTAFSAIEALMEVIKKDNRERVSQEIAVQVGCKKILK